MNDILFDIDYSLDDCKDKYVIDLSFTYFHWKLIEIMSDEKELFDLKSIDNSLVKQLT